MNIHIPKYVSCPPRLESSFSSGLQFWEYLLSLIALPTDKDGRYYAVSNTDTKHIRMIFNGG